jgi:hypothetical protein
MAYFLLKSSFSVSSWILLLIVISFMEDFLLYCEVFLDNKLQKNIYFQFLKKVFVFFKQKLDNFVKQRNKVLGFLALVLRFPKHI